MSPRTLLPVALAGVLLLTACAPAPAPTETAAPSASSTTATATATAPLPDGFAHLSDVAPGVRVHLRYATSDNFTGGVVDGYGPDDVGVLRTEAAEALALVQADLEAQGLGLLVWDAFRPTRAVADFVAWSYSDDESTKAQYYPEFDKPELFELGYIAEKSGHSLGGTVDLTLVEAATGAELDMGGPFDFFGSLSNVGAAGITDDQQRHRELLADAMTARGFVPYDMEWWHFSYPVPDGTAAADFPVR